jgi:methionyl-tRNA formyltransferase
MDKLKLVFFGTPEFATYILSGLVGSDHEVVAVVTVADKPAGRGQKVTMSHVKKYALEQNIPVLQPTNLKSESFTQELTSLNADLFIVVAFRMLPKSVWSMPTKGTFNLHASLLPQYRGAAPINWAVINQEKESGATTFFIDDKIDTGAIIKQASCKLENNETAGSLYEKLMQLGKDLTVDTVNDVAGDQVSTLSQKNNKELREAPKLNLENTTIDFNKSCQEVDALVRGLYPFPIAKAILVDKERTQLKIFETSIVNKVHNMTPGSIIISDKNIMVACAEGFVILKKLQFPGKKPMLSKDLLNGYQFDAEARFDTGLA